MIFGNWKIRGFAWGIAGGNAQAPGDPEPIPVKVVLVVMPGGGEIELLFETDDWAEFQRQVAAAGPAGQAKPQIAVATPAHLRALNGAGLRGL